MTKQDKIKEEWIKSIGIDNYNLIKESICENGTIYEYILRDFKIYSEDFLFKSNGDNEPDEYQLKSLQGIEDNNGWIKIESEEDLPKDDSVLYDLSNIENKGYLAAQSLYMLIDFYKTRTITHYAIYVQRKPPIH